jgi:SAM-dependent methyltransferase
VHTQFLEYLKCPKTGEPLQVRIREQRGPRIVSGTLWSSAASYEISRGVPRFVPAEGNYASSFGYQWAKWRCVQFEGENATSAMAGHTRSMFERIVMQQPSAFNDGVILDIGCGSGRFIDVVRRKGTAKVIGIDFSSAADVAAEIFKDDDNVLIVQGDALALPVRDRVASGAYSIGVLHHTPDPRRGFEEMVKATHPGGWVALCVYGKGSFYDDPRVLAYRRLFKWLKPAGGTRAPLIYAMFAAHWVYPLTRWRILGPLMRMLFPMARLPDARWRVLDTFDAVSPVYQSTHESHEVFRWFKDAGLCEIEPSDWGFTAYHGRVSGAGEMVTAQSARVSSR